MAVNSSRSMNLELSNGMTEGKYRSIARGRGGQIDEATENARSDLHAEHHGTHARYSVVDLDDRERPDGRKVNPLRDLDLELDY